MEMSQILIGLAGFIVYFIPMLIGMIRKHRSILAIAAVNVLFGWTGIGWIWAFIWSLTGTVKGSQ